MEGMRFHRPASKLRSPEFNWSQRDKEASHFASTVLLGQPAGYSPLTFQSFTTLAPIRLSVSFFLTFNYLFPEKAKVWYRPVIRR